MQEREGASSQATQARTTSHNSGASMHRARRGDGEARSDARHTFPVHALRANTNRGKATVLVRPLTSITRYAHATLLLPPAHQGHPTAALRQCRHGNAAHAQARAHSRAHPHPPSGAHTHIQLICMCACAHRLSLDGLCSGDRCASRTRTHTHARAQRRADEASTTDKQTVDAEAGGQRGRKASDKQCAHVHARERGVKAVHAHDAGRWGRCARPVDDPAQTHHSQTTNEALTEGEEKTRSGRYR